MQKIKNLIDLITYPVRWLIGYFMTKELFEQIQQDTNSDKED